MKNLKTRTIIMIAMMSTLSFVLYAFEITLIYPYKFDLSDVPALIMAIVSGPYVAICVALTKNILHAIFLMKEPLFSGEIANFAYCVAFILPISLWFKNNNHKKLIAVVSAIVISTIAMIPINLFITLPLYGISLSKESVALIITTFTPLNLVKGSTISILLFMLTRYLKKPLEKLA